LCKRGANGLL
nr:immunoglobulin heavy chain junction region [Mus musculus]